MQEHPSFSGSVEVLLATARRPEYLEIALESVVKQNLGNRIDRVVVSENGNDRRSESVAGRFSDRLPIEYRFKSPLLSPLEHRASLFEGGAADYIAFLCDDDWWLDGFLARSLVGLDGHNECVAAFSASFWCKHEHDTEGTRYFPLALRTVAGATEVPVRLSGDQVHAAAWIVTPFHFSTMVARKGPLRRAASKLRNFDPFNIDRLLEMLLSVEGDILFFPQFGAGIRQHETNWSIVEKRESALRSDCQAVRFARSSAQSLGCDVVGFWKDRLKQLSLSERREILRALARIYEWDELRQLGLIRSAAGTGATGALREIGLRYGGKISAALPVSLRRQIKRLI